MTARPAFALSLLLFLPLLAAAPPAAVEQQEEEAFRISVDVNLVVLHVSVHDRRGSDVLNLRQQDFTLFEDGVPQTIRMFRREDAPVTAGLIVDHSGSMGPKLGQVIAAAGTFAGASNPRDQIFVVNFNEKIRFGLWGATKFTDDPVILGNAIAGVPAAGKTALYDAIAAGLDRLDTGHWDKKVLVVISDGGDNASVHQLQGVIGMAERSSAAIYAIGMFDNDDKDANPRVLKRLAEETGGEAFFPKEPNEVVEICAHIANDIRNQYMIGYVSTNVFPDGTRRSIRLLAKAPDSGTKLHVRTRSSYIAQGAGK
jgi:VWFA-related protein